MPTLSMFFGIIIRMYYKEHMPPHFHAYYQDCEATFGFDGELIEGDMPAKQRKLVSAWALIHEDELSANWELAMSKDALYKIEPLR